MSKPMNYVLVITPKFSEVMQLADRAGVPRNWLIQAYDIKRIQGLQRGMKFVVLSPFRDSEKNREMLNHMRIRLHTEIQPDDVRAEVLGEAA